MAKLVSIIIVNFNAGNYLTECVRSVCASTIDLEIFISDNGSTDKSLQQLRHAVHDKRVTIIENKANLGFSKGNNVVLPKANGDYILFLNPDCVVKTGTLEQMVKTMEENPPAGMSGCLIRNEDNSVQATCVRSIPTPWNSLVRILHLNKLFPHWKIFHGLDLGGVALPTVTTAVSAISGAFMFVRRTALEEVGTLDERYFLYGEDVDWMYRFRQAAWQILFVPQVEIVHAKGVCGVGRPFRVLWYKHRAMVMFYNNHFAKRYSFIHKMLVYAAIAGRFFLLTFFAFFKKPYNL